MSTRNGLAAKSLYTPIFYSSEASTPSSSTDTNPTRSKHKTPSAYLGNLSRTHLALAQIVEEVPPSRCGSPRAEGDLVPDDKTRGDARVEALRDRVLDAFNVANGEPADGKWGGVMNALKMGCTRGRYRWAGTSKVGKRRALASSHPTDWLLATTDAEWIAWETKREEEEHLKKKVESWKKGVGINVSLNADVDLGGVRAPEVISVSDDSDGTKVDVDSGKVKAKAADGAKEMLKVTAKTNGHDPKDPSPLGFAVVKRSTVNLSASKPVGKPHPKLNPKPTKAPSPPDLNAANVDPIAQSDVPAAPAVAPNPPMPPTPKDSDVEMLDQEPPKQPPTPRPSPPKKGISDISEMSFLPPSFPSQLPTSTPNPNPEHKPKSTRIKVPPIPFASPSSPPLSSPRSLRVYGRPRPTPSGIPATASLPTFPLTPTNEPRGEKRPRSLTPQHAAALKKARTMPLLSPGPSPHPDHESNHNPRPILGAPILAPASTPPQRSTPTPNDDKAKPHPDQDHNQVEPPLTTPKRPAQLLPTLTELLASSKKNRTSPKVKKTPGLNRIERIEEDDDLLHQKTDIKGKGKARYQPHSNSRPNSPSRSPKDNKNLPFQPLHHDHDHDPYGMNMNLNMDLDLNISPTKSLSSLAGSDSDSDSDHGPVSPSLMRVPPFSQGALGAGGFEPVCASTQVQGQGHFGGPRDGVFGMEGAMNGSLGSGMGSGEGFGFGMRYNSQYDVEGQVDRVSELLEKDVDFGGWLRDVSVEDGDGEEGA